MGKGGLEEGKERQGQRKGPVSRNRLGTSQDPGGPSFWTRIKNQNTITLIPGTNGNPAPLLMNGAHGLVILGQDGD